MKKKGCKIINALFDEIGKSVGVEIHRSGDTKDDTVG